MRKLLYIFLFVTGIANAQNIGILPSAVSPKDTNAVMVWQGGRPGCKKTYRLNLQDLKSFNNSGGGGDITYSSNVWGSHGSGDGFIAFFPDSGEVNQYWNYSYIYQNQGNNSQYDTWVNERLDTVGLFPQAEFFQGLFGYLDNYIYTGQYLGGWCYMDVYSNAYGTSNNFKFDAYILNRSVLYFNPTQYPNKWNIYSESVDTIAINKVKISTDGKISAPGGIDPPYISFSNESEASIEKMSTHCKDDVMLYYDADKHKFRTYNKKERKFKKA